MKYEPWIGVDLDGTLAEYHGWRDDGSVGNPIEPMRRRVLDWLGDGREVRIMTARVASDDMIVNARQRAIIEDWCRKHLGRAMAVTCVKDMAMIELWDDRAVQVIPNTGERADGN